MERMITNQEMTPALRHPPIPGIRHPATAIPTNSTKRNCNFMTEKENPRITAFRLLAVAVDDHEPSRADHGRLILSQIKNDGSMIEVLLELADIAAILQRSRYGPKAYDRTISEIQRLADPYPDPYRLLDYAAIPPDQRTPRRPQKDRPIRRNK